MIHRIPRSVLLPYLLHCQQHDQSFELIWRDRIVVKQSHPVVDRDLDQESPAERVMD